MEKHQTIKEWYAYALKDPDIHACTTMDLSKVDIEQLFTGSNSKEFIRSYFEYLYSNSSVNPAGRFVDNIERITNYRAQHTVASFLLGIIVKEALTLDVRNWIRVSDSHSSDPSFGFFWSLICLTHDIAYYWERNSKKLIDNYKTVDDFCSVQSIQYNLLKVSNKNTLIKNYYSYCIEYRHKIDHGITGAILIYDALMSFYNDDDKQHSTSRICGIHMRKSFPAFCLKIAETIALHNMWRADDRTRDVYLDFQLDELIPSDEAKHIINYKDDILLFLLGLIDSIDPIKSFCNAEGSGTRLPVDVVLNGYRLNFTNRAGIKRVNIQFHHSAFKDKYLKTIMGLSQWLDVDTETSLDSASIILNPGIKTSVKVEVLQAV